MLINALDCLFARNQGFLLHGREKLIGLILGTLGLNNPMLALK
jgi:hypothetical protein